MHESGLRWQGAGYDKRFKVTRPSTAFLKQTPTATSVLPGAEADFFM
jgi:hypothetical protein